MTAPALAQQTAFGRMYARAVGGTLEAPSITTVIAQAATDLTGWAGHMAATAVISDARLAAAIGTPRQLSNIARDASRAAETYRDTAAARGDRVHAFAEQLALQRMGRDHDVEGAQEALLAHGESAYGERLREWFTLYGVEPLAAEVTVWNHTVGYAGTLDLVARIGGRVCLIDYKTKGVNREGRAKPLDAKVVMQLAAGYKAEESVVDAAAGTWEPWAYGDAGTPPLLLGVAVAETEVVAQQAQPEVLPIAWRKFWALRQVWEAERVMAAAGPALRPIAPPPVAAGQVT